MTREQAVCSNPTSNVQSNFDVLTFNRRALLRGLGQWEAWILPLVYAVCNDLYRFAIKADDQLQQDGKKAERLEEAARIINRAFTACIGDRSDIYISRKWGTYYITGLMFKIYFKVYIATLLRFELM